MQKGGVLPCPLTLFSKLKKLLRRHLAVSVRVHPPFAALRLCLHKSTKQSNEPKNPRAFAYDCTQ